MKENHFENVDISASIAYTICPKEDSELAAIKKACNVTVDVFTKYLKDNIMDIIDSDKVSLMKSIQALDIPQHCTKYKEISQVMIQTDFKLYIGQYRKD